MDSELDTQNYLYLSPKNLKIKIFRTQDFKELYFNEISTEYNPNENNFNFVNIFLEKNIFHIERKINKFIKKINLIINSDEFLTINLSIKKENYGEVLRKEDFTHLLNEARYECKKTIDYRRITHMLIDNYYIDKKNYSLFPENLRCNFFSIDIRFICLSEAYIKEIEKILKKYQITINRVLSSEYVENFLDHKDEDIFMMSTKIVDGFNENEVTIVPKIPNNKGFFERFFNFFN
tara:strand:+ start:7244 stop:7948 length:705 start_codon:yes stop_codon:yes gene_type:complete